MLGYPSRDVPVERLRWNVSGGTNFPKKEGTIHELSLLFLLVGFQQFRFYLLFFYSFYSFPGSAWECLLRGSASDDKARQSLGIRFPGRA